MEENTKPIGIDLCSGVGGMSLGFEQAGFEIIASVEVDPIHVATHAKNFPNCVGITANLSEITGNEIRTQANLENREIDVLFGGPPCGGFSTIGHRRVEDPRNQLLLHFARLVTELKPKYFVVENVRGILVGPMLDIVKEFIGIVEEAGYKIVKPIQTLNASDFGVPQHRQRVFILGYRKGLTPPTYPMISGSSKPTVWDAIGDLPDIDRHKELENSDVYTRSLGPTSSEYARILRGDIRDDNDRSPIRHRNGNGLSGCQQTKHQSTTVERFKETEQGTIEPNSRLYRLSKTGQARTLRAGTGKDRGSYSAPRPIHPLYPRCISVREGARLHSFPDWFQFHQTKWHGFRQIGNSVPPFLARAVANSIYEQI